ERPDAVDGGAEGRDLAGVGESVGQYLVLTATAFFRYFCTKPGGQVRGTGDQLKRLRDRIDLVCQLPDGRPGRRALLRSDFESLQSSGGCIDVLPARPISTILGSIPSGAFGCRTLWGRLMSLP